MVIYWAIFIILAAGALLNRPGKEGRRRHLFILLAGLPTVLMIGLRWEIGADWTSYVRIFEFTKLFSLQQAVEHVDPAFAVLQVALHQLRSPFWVLNMVGGIIFIGGLASFCARQPNPWLSFLVVFPYLVIVVAMSGQRQSLALGCLFFALNAFEREHLKRFAAWIVLGALFHGSLILMLPICLLAHTRNALQNVLLLLAAVGLGIFTLHDTFDTYAGRYSSESLQSSGVAFRLAMNGLAAALFLLLGNRFNFEEHQARLWRNMSWCSLLLIPLLLVIPSSTAIDRFVLYLFPLQCVVLGRLPQLAERKSQVLNTLGVIAYAAIVQVTFLVFGTFAGSYVPYRSILTG